MKGPAYEAILAADCKPAQMFLQLRNYSSCKLHPIDPNNPKWDRWMTRVQEASLRDRYELQPLQSMQKVLQHYAEHAVDPEQRQFYGEALQTTEAVLASAASAPWTCETMQQARKLKETCPWIAESDRVGSFRKGTRVYPPSVNKVRELSHAVATMQVEQARTLMKALQSGQTMVPLPMPGHVLPQRGKAGPSLLP